MGGDELAPASLHIPDLERDFKASEKMFLFQVQSFERDEIVVLDNGVVKAFLPIMPDNVKSRAGQ